MSTFSSSSNPWITKITAIDKALYGKTPTTAPKSLWDSLHKELTPTIDETDGVDCEAEEQVVGTKYNLVCPICSGPIEAILKTKRNWLPYDNSLAPSRNYYALSYKPCDCPVVNFVDQ